MTAPSESAHAFCTECGTRLTVGGRFCHGCGAPIPGGGARVAASGSSRLVWAVPAAAIFAVVALSVISNSRSTGGNVGSPAPQGGGMRAPDISSMSPDERADRLFDRVMRLSSERKADSVALFAPMALAAIEAIGPLDAHRRFDLGRVALAAGDVAMAKAAADTILAERATHLLGLALAARVADARNNAAASRGFIQRLVAAERSEMALGLPGYAEHSREIRAAVDDAAQRRD
ncbi:MAG TPA: zinc ribbon domain-containing protein [Gemmatimonadaceae bacterium]|nr:zinc ribbon domain-containing protein [Gemmatimonadaceae bacterium]